jgi:hypothetical protein
MRTNVANVPPYLGQLPLVVQLERLHLQGRSQACNQLAVQAEDCLRLLIGKMKIELKRVSKSESVSHFHNGLLPNKRDGMSAIALHFPSMCMGVSGHARCILRCIAKACTRCSTTIDYFDARHVTQLIDGELLQNNVTRFS